MKQVLVTFLYPDAVKYINEFIRCIQGQSMKDYVLVIFNDGVVENERYFSDISIPFKIIDVTGTPTQVRFMAFEWLKNSEFEKIIFHDIDDLMSENRLQCVTGLLDKCDIVANDLSLMDEEGRVFDKSIWGDRLGDEFKFSYEFISNKNILGIGNSAIRKEILDIPILFSNVPLVADWFMYYQILFIGKKNAVFTNQCQTFYRQHSNNMAGVKQLTRNRLEYVFKVKESNYEALENVGINIAEQKKELENQKKQFDNLLNKNKNESHFFWWEETLN